MARAAENVLPRGDPAPSAPWLDRLLALVATWAPFAIAVTRAASAGQWRDDLPAVRDLGLVAVGVGEASPRSSRRRCASSRSVRAPSAPRSDSAIALAVASRLLYGLVRRALALSGTGPGAIDPSPRLGAALAAIATLTAALSPTFQREATVGGGAMIAVALVLAALSIGLRMLQGGGTAHAWIGLGALLGATFAESPPAALATASMIAALLLARRVAPLGMRLRVPSGRVAILAAAFAVAAAALLLAPLALRPLAPRPWADVGRALSAAGVSGLDAAGARTTALAAWIREVGVVSLGIAAFGAGVALLRPRLRPIVAPLLALIALDTILPAKVAGVLSADPLTVLRSLAVAAIAVASAIGVREVVARILDARFPMARAAAVLVVVFHLTLAALTSEEAGFSTDRSEQLAAEVWADEALGQLEPRSAVLVPSPAIAFRMWAARLLRGERPTWS